MTSHVTHWLSRGLLSLLITVPVAAFALTPSQVFDKVKDSVLVVKALDAQGKPLVSCHTKNVVGKYGDGKIHRHPGTARERTT